MLRVASMSASPGGEIEAQGEILQMALFETRVHPRRNGFRPRHRRDAGGSRRLNALRSPDRAMW